MKKKSLPSMLIKIYINSSDPIFSRIDDGIVVRKCCLYILFLMDPICTVKLIEVLFIVWFDGYVKHLCNLS